MMVFVNNILMPIFLSIVVLVVVYIWGKFVFFNMIDKDWDLGEAIFLMGGNGLLVLLALLLSLFGSMKIGIILVILLATIIVGYKYVFNLIGKVKLFFREIKKWERSDLILFLGIILFFVFYLTSALVPPYRTDALAYHLPEAIGVAENGISFLTDGTIGNFYKNIPASIEVMDALLYCLGGFTLIHLIHYSILLSSLFFLYKFIKKYFNRSKALLCILLVFSLYDLFVNGTNAYVDAVMASWEISGLILLMLWIKLKDDRFIIFSGFFYGLAMGTKYNALYGILLAGLIFIVYLVKSRSKLLDVVKKVLYFGVPIFLVAGFWYLKNFIFYGNPVYPFYFGHPGFEDEGFAQMVTVIKSFIMDRTFVNFIFLPFNFFLKSYYIVLFLAFIAWPFIFLAKKFNKDERDILKIVSFYIFTYSTIWFFVATHQTKFFYVPMILLLVIFAIELDLVGRYILNRFNFKVVWVIFSIVVLAIGYKVVTAKNNYFISVKKADLAYIIGIDNKSGFYQRKEMGHIYRASQFINSNFKDVTFLNVWSTTRFFLEEGNKFLYPSELIYNKDKVLTASTILFFLREKDIKYIIIDENNKKRSANDEILSKVCDQDPKCAYYKNRTEIIEKVVKDVNIPFYNNEGVALYNLENIDK